MFWLLLVIGVCEGCSGCCVFDVVAFVCTGVLLLVLCWLYFAAYCFVFIVLLV